LLEEQNLDPDELKRLREMLEASTRP
jgi:hypothetical protein